MALKTSLEIDVSKFKQSLESAIAQGRSAAQTLQDAFSDISINLDGGKEAAASLKVLSSSFDTARSAANSSLGQIKSAMASLVVQGKGGTAEFELLRKKFQETAAQAKELDSALKQVDAGLDGAGQSAQDNAGLFGNLKSGIGDAFSGIAGSLGSLGPLLAGGGIAAGLAGIASGIGAAASKMIETNKEFETFKTQLTTLTGSADIAENRIKELAKFGAETPFELPELVKAEKVMLGFGLTGERAMKLTGKSAEEFRTVVGDISAGVGVNFEELAVTFGKFSSGATGESISRLQELGIVTREELKGVGVEFSKSGELLSPINKALTSAVSIAQEKFGGGMKALSATASGQLSTLQDNFDSFFRDIGGSVFDQFKGVVSGINGFFGSDTFSGIKAAFKSGLDGVGEFVAGFTDGFSSLYGKVQPILEIIVGYWRDVFMRNFIIAKTVLQVAFDGIAAVFNAIVSALDPVFTAFAELRDAFGSSGDSATTFADIMQTVTEVAKSVGQFIAEFIVVPLRVVATVVGSVIRFIADMIEKFQVFERVSKAASGAADGFRSAITFVRSVIEGATAAFREINAVMGEVFDAITNFRFDKLGDIIANGAQRIGSSFNTAFDQTQQGAKKAEGAANDAFAAYKKLYDQIDTLKANVANQDIETSQIISTKKTIAEQIKAAETAKTVTADKAAELSKLLSRIANEGYTTGAKALAQFRKDVASNLFTEDQLKKQADAVKATIDQDKIKGRIQQAEYKKLIDALEAIDIKAAKTKKEKSDSEAKQRAEDFDDFRKVEEQKLTAVKNSLEKQAAAERRELSGAERISIARQEIALRELLVAKSKELFKLTASESGDITAINVKGKNEELDKLRETFGKLMNDLSKSNVAFLNLETKLDEESFKQSVADIKQQSEQFKRDQDSALTLNVALAVGADDFNTITRELIDDLERQNARIASLRVGASEEQAAALEKLTAQNAIRIREISEQGTSIEQEARIRSITDRTEREMRLEILAIERVRDERLKRSSNPDEELSAVNEFWQKRSEIEEKYLRQSSVLYRITQSTRSSLENVFVKSLTENQSKITDDQRKSLAVQKTDLLKQLKERTISFEQYSKSIVEIDAQLKTPEFDFTNSLNAAFADSARLIAESAKKAADNALAEYNRASDARIALARAEAEKLAQIEQARANGNTEQEQKLTTELAVIKTERVKTDESLSQTTTALYSAVAEQAAASLAQVVFDGGNASKALIGITFNTLDSIVPILVAQIVGQSLAQLGPVGGAIVSGALVATFKGLVAIARSAAGFKKGGYTGDGARDEEAGVVHKGEVVFEQPIVENQVRDVLELRSIMQSGVTAREIIERFKSEDSQYSAIQRTVTAMTNAEKTRFADGSFGFNALGATTFGFNAQPVFHTAQSRSESIDITPVVEKLGDVCERVELLGIQIRRNTSVSVSGTLTANSGKILAELDDKRARRAMR